MSVINIIYRSWLGERAIGREATHQEPAE